MQGLNQILIDREKRHNLIHSLTKDYNVITVKANVAGGCKNIYPSFVLSNYYANLIYKKWGYKPIIDQNSDGICYIFTLKDDIDYKEYTTFLEEQTPLGRLVDIDVHFKNCQSSVTRNATRKCFLCDNPAFVCGRLKSHSISQLNDFLTEKTRNFFRREISKIIKESLLCELQLENKFGLVTKTTSGSHPDMDYFLMQKAQDSIIGDITESFFIGLKGDDPSKLMDVLRPIGLECENNMLKATSGVNAYKGFIFISMILLPSLGYALKEANNGADVFEISKILASHKSVIAPLNTFGYGAYKDSFFGVRGEAFNGFPTVQKASKALNSNSLHKVLCTIVGDIDDTVLLKRAKSFERYLYFKNMISCVDTTNTAELKRVTEICVENNISIGGAADILCCGIMINKLKQLFYF